MLEVTLAHYVSGITFQSIDPKIIHIIKRNLLDSYAGICASLQDREMIQKFDRMTSMTQTGEEISIWELDRKGIAE